MKKQYNLYSYLERFSHESSLILKLGLKVIIVHLLKIMMQFVDTIMAGNVSSLDLAGLASATALYHPVFFPNVRNIDYAGSDYSTTI